MNYAVRFYLKSELVYVLYGIRGNDKTLSTCAKEAIKYVREKTNFSFDRAEIDSWYGDESYITIIVKEEFNFVFRIEEDL